jgi:hypothetical protein
MLTTNRIPDCQGFRHGDWPNLIVGVSNVPGLVPRLSCVLPRKATLRVPPNNPATIALLPPNAASALIQYRKGGKDGHAPTTVVASYDGMTHKYVGRAASTRLDAGSI